jgi:hypothetical protein
VAVGWCIGYTHNGQHSMACQASSQVLMAASFNDQQTDYAMSATCCCCRCCCCCRLAGSCLVSSLTLTCGSAPTRPAHKL